MPQHKKSYKFLLWVIAVIIPFTGHPTAQAEDFSNGSGITPIFVSSRGEARAFSGHRVQINLRMPKANEPLTVELLNHTSFNIGLVEFDLNVLGASGKIRFSSIAAGASGRNIIQIPSSRELSIRNILVFNEDASEQFPRVIVQVIWPKGGNASQPGS